jgi:hypothetical protein
MCKNVKFLFNPIYTKVYFEALGNKVSFVTKYKLSVILICILIELEEEIKN